MVDWARVGDAYFDFLRLLIWATAIGGPVVIILILTGVIDAS